MKRVVQRECRIPVAEAHNAALLRVMQVGKDIGTAIGYDAVRKRCG